jgi:hypothetical protein
MISDILFGLEYSSNLSHLKVKVALMVELADQGIDHILVQTLKGTQLKFALCHLHQLIMHSLSIDKD